MATGESMTVYVCKKCGKLWNPDTLTCCPFCKTPKTEGLYTIDTSESNTEQIAKQLKRIADTLDSIYEHGITTFTQAVQ
jgi:uncharacterized Zn finger protein (UPF0148 family)